MQKLLRDIQEKSRQLQHEVEALIAGSRETIGPSLKDNLHLMKTRLGDSTDIVMRDFEAGDPPNRFGLVYVEGLVDRAEINDMVMRSLMVFAEKSLEPYQNAPPDQVLDAVCRRFLSLSDVQRATRLHKIIRRMLSGDTVLLLDGVAQAVLIGTRQWEERTVEEPKTEQVIRGPREGFTETLRTNTAMLRRHLRTEDLIIKSMNLGGKTHTEIVVCYLEGVAQHDVVDAVRRRLHAIEVDSVLESGYLEQFIEDNHLSPFPQVKITERPDAVVGNLLEGRVAILTSGTPFALVVPATFTLLYQTPEDYYTRFAIATLIRLVRLVAVLFSLIFPSLYVALLSFHPDMIPTDFAVAVAGGRAGIPFPSVIEVFVLEGAMEILREATIRLPQAVGGALTIVGVLIVGQAAVSAGFVSPISVVVVAVTTLGSFATPEYNAAIALRMLRFPLLVLAGVFGLYGMMVGLIFITNHMLSLSSFGVPYLSPLSPMRLRDLKDSVVRSPLWTLQKRPQSTQPQETTRIGVGPRDVFDEKGRPAAPRHGRPGDDEGEQAP